jgi:putative transcriptional regulator
MEFDYFTSDQWIEPKKGDLLISEPYLPDPNFERTVILICEHDENGTIGFVLNKQAQVGLSDVMDELSGAESSLYVGGPVQQDTLHFIHRCDQLKDRANEVQDGIFWGGNYDKLTSLINTRALAEEDIRFFVGYSGWSAGQLLDELKEKSWIVFQNTTPELIFETPPPHLWQEVLRLMGGKFKLISNYPTDPRLN